MNNQFLGNLRESKLNNESPSKIFFIFGSILGFLPYLFLLTIKSSAAVLIWNTFVAPSGFSIISFSTAFGAVTILSLATIKYSGTSFVNNFIDLAIKIILLVLTTQLYSYFI